jgi:hypothetical protein
MNKAKQTVSTFAVLATFFSKISFRNALSHDQQRQPRHQEKHHKKRLEQTQKRVHNQVKTLPGNRKPLALCTVNEIGSSDHKQAPEEQNTGIDDSAPHKESCQRLKTHCLAPVVSEPLME